MAASAAVFAVIVVITLPRRANAAESTAPVVVNDVGRDLRFNDDWKFSLGDDMAAKDVGFNDSGWRALDLPHDWSIEGKFDPKLASCTAFLPCGIGWYRKAFILPSTDADRLITIRFDGVMNHSTVWCNGQQVGQRPYGYSSFTCDLTPAIKFGGANVIAVRVDHELYADSRWYAGSGIYRNVFLNVLDKVHIDNNGVFVTTPNVASDAAEIDVQTVVKNEGASGADVSVNTAVQNSGGVTVASLEQNGGLQGGSGKLQFLAIIKIPRPALWSPDHPNLYRIETQVKQGGALIDDCTTPFGIRTFTFDPDKGFSINGQSMKLKGVCIHQDAGALGVAVPIQVWERRLKFLRDGGCNAIRCSHNPPAPEFLDLCDRMGFLVMDEAFDEWTGGKHKWVVGHNVGTASTDGYHSDFDKWADIDIRDMVLRDRNHPSIIMWSIGNEIDYQYDPFPPNSPELPPIAARLIKDVKAVDQTRPVTAACAFPATNLFKTLLDIEGFNYMEDLYADDHAAHPTRVIYGSENKKSLDAWEAVAKNDYIAGQFLWTGVDYLGEAGVWPSHASGSGLLDLAGFPKAEYYFRKSLWTDEPMVYLTPTRYTQDEMRGIRRPLAPANSFTCYTNCDRVELFHDGISLGSQPASPGKALTWTVDFASGVLKAVGTKGTAMVAYELKKAGAPASLALLTDVAQLQADGRDVGQIEVDVVDKNGVLVPDAANRVDCTLTGPGKIIGIANGDTSSTESYKAMSHSVYHGRMLIYVQSSKSFGEVSLTVSTPNLERASVTLPVR